MKIGMILLDGNNVYVHSDGSLPIRPDWDKGFIKDFIRNKVVLCSQNVLDTVPKSMKAIAHFTTLVNSNYDINWGISTFVNKPDMIMVTRSKVSKKLIGKVFRLDDYFKVFEDEKGLELWLKK